MPAVVSLVSFVLIAFTAAPVRAELVFLSSGRTLSVKAVRAEGNSVVLALRSGGEIVCDRSLIARIEADEIPYPDPADAASEIRLKPDPTIETNPTIELDGDEGRHVSTNALYDPIIDRAAATHGVDATLVRAVIQVESGYRPRARSRKGAKGLMQLMPETARQYAVRDPYDPRSNIEAGTRHLKSLLERFPLNLALAAYNAGEAAVRRFGDVPPYPETRDYVARILALVHR
jgi:hypothetical protein